MYIRFAKTGEDGLLSAQPDFRSSADVAVNTEMGPASRVRGSGGLVSAQALTAAGRVEPDGEPGGVSAIVQNNRVAHGTGKGALTAGGGDAVKVAPPSVETDAPEMLIGLALRPRESL